MSSHLPLFQIKSFNLAIIDEASQILEPHLMGILSAHTKGVPAIQKIVLIGDHKQLPAVVQQSAERSLVKEPLLRSIHLTDCRLSLFERLLKQYSNDPSVVYMLKRQGRMHQEIAQFPSLQFYNNQLDIVPLPHQQNPLPNQVTTTYPIDDLLKTHRLVFLHCPAPQKSVSDKVNSNEAQLIADILQHIYQKEKKSFNSHETVGVIVPYRNQIATIRKAIDQLGIPPLLDISIDTIERYQGSQRKYIIYGFTIQKYYQLDFLTNQVFRDMDGQLIDRKLNVGMTRAKEFLFLVGNHSLLSRFSLFSQLIDFIRQKGGYREVSPETSSTNAH
jgi:superfamily I DNA and/or RNA helicase